jgi:acyl-CoA thioesterase-1
MNKLRTSISVAFWPVLSAVAIASACNGRPDSAGPLDPSGVRPATAQRIVVLGDSLAVSPTREESFPSVLQSRIVEAGLGWTVTNAGISGDTTTGGLRRIEALLGDDVGVLVLALGANDGLRGVDLQTIEHNLATMIEKARARGIDVLLCGMETPPLHDWQYSIGFHNLFPKLAARYAIPLVPFLLSGVALNPQMNGNDGIHPNSAGARRIAETVWPFLQPLIAP